MHGPEECSFTNLIFEKVENVLKLKRNTNVRLELWMKKEEHQLILKNVLEF